MCACADVSNFKYRDVKMFLLKLGSELPNLDIKFQPVLKIQTKYRLYFHEVECTAGSNYVDNIQAGVTAIVAILNSKNKRKPKVKDKLEQGF